MQASNTLRLQSRARLQGSPGVAVPKPEVKPVFGQEKLEKAVCPGLLKGHKGKGLALHRRRESAQCGIVRPYLCLCVLGEC